jgi:hypothetical protein
MGVRVGRGAILAGLVLLLPGAEPGAADAPRWPLDVPPVLTSSFGEYRPNHFHAGIDFATGGRTGLVCRSVGDGSVVRMRMSPYGYGKALYIQMDQGPLVVYAHLSAFADPMAKRARAEQKRLGRYTFDIQVPPGEMRVLRGAVIAWSGDTGIGVPHLHFEMRDGDLAQNPQSLGFKVPDTIAPVIGGVYATPMDATSHVAGELDTRELAAGGAPLVVGGRVGFSVKAWDHAASREHRQAPYRYELRVDGKVLFQLLHERFEYADNHLMNLEYDQERLVAKRERVQLLYRRDGDRLPGREAPAGQGGLFVMGGDGADSVGFAPGEHTLEVEVADVAGHATVHRARIRASRRPRVALDAEREDGRAAWRCMAEDADLALGGEELSARVWVSRDAGARWDSLATTSGAEPEVRHRVWNGVVAWDGVRPILLRARVRDRAGLEATALWSSAWDGQSELGYEVRQTWAPRWVELDIELPTAAAEPPRIMAADMQCPSCVVQLRGARRSWAVVPVEMLGSKIELQTGPLDRPNRMPVAIDAKLLRRGVPARVEDLAPGLIVDVPSGALLEDAALRAEKRNPAALELGTELRTAGACLRVEPRTLALDKPIRVALAPAGGDTAHVGLFWVNRSGDLRLLSRQRDADGRFSGDTRFLSDFALLADTTPPRIGPVHVTPRGQRPERLRFTVRDEGARMGDGGIETTLDGERAIPEWDSETGGVIVEPDAKLGAGAHTLRVVATDQLGNRATRSLQFTVP